MEIWNVFHRTLQGQERTNNYSEACHKKIQHAFGMAHPTIWKFLEGLKLTIKGYDTDYEQFIAGNPRPAKRTKYVDLDNQILDKVFNFDPQGNLFEYLRGISQNYVME